jgi:hypothetical protein
MKGLKLLNSEITFLSGLEDQRWTSGHEVLPWTAPNADSKTPQKQNSAWSAAILWS